MTMTTAQARNLGWAVETGNYRSASDDRADRWYAYRWDTFSAVDHRGAGCRTRREALACVERHVTAAEAALEWEGEYQVVRWNVVLNVEAAKAAKEKCLDPRGNAPPISMSYGPKLDAVFDGRCTQTIRQLASSCGTF